VLWIGFAILGILRARTIPFFAVVGGPIAALNFQSWAIQTYGAAPKIDGSWKALSLGGRIASILAGLALLFAAWPGWLHVRRVAWNLEVDPSLSKAAQRICELRSKGVLSPDSRGFNSIPPVAHYLAWFCPAEKGFL